jgi:hypothetical protein
LRAYTGFGGAATAGGRDNHFGYEVRLIMKIVFDCRRRGRKVQGGEWGEEARETEVLKYPGPRAMTIGVL